MLTLLGSPQRVCHGTSRRQLLQAAGMGLLGVGLPQVYAAEALQRPRDTKAKSILFLYIYGGPSQLETFDMKPEAPSGIRGPFQPIASRTPGLLISQHLPRMAAMSDKFSVIRTMTHTHNNHHACHWIQTGRPWHLPETILNATPDKDCPAIGSMIEYLDQRDPARTGREIPSYWYVPAPLGHLQGYDYPGQYAGWLGRSFNALATNFRRRDAKDNPYFRDIAEEELNLKLQGLDPQPELVLDRLNRRQTLLQQFDSARRSLDASQRVQTHDQLWRRAFDLANSAAIRQALDIRQESPALRDRYGRHLFGQAAILGRRLIEAGGRFVTVQWEAPDGYSWDSHIHSNDVEKQLSPRLDQTYSALIEDMSERGLLDETLVVLISEMGRGPLSAPPWGRGHWCHAFPAVLAGGGIKGGTIYGKTDKDAGYPADHPVSPADLAATLFHALGIDPALRITDSQGRPVPLVEESGRPIRELFG
jgi:uncharacterized protein (DUF1501 family)